MSQPAFGMHGYREVLIAKQAIAVEGWRQNQWVVRLRKRNLELALLSEKRRIEAPARCVAVFMERLTHGFDAILAVSGQDPHRSY